MYRLLETIRMENLQVENLAAHQFRMDQSCLHFFGHPSGLKNEDLVVDIFYNNNTRKIKKRKF